MYKLRELEKNDIPFINKWRADKSLISKLGAPFRYINLDTDNRWYESYLNNRSSNLRCVIVNKKNNDEIIGLVSLTEINHINQSAIFHIMIGNSRNRSKGAGYFATKEMLHHAFYNLNLNRIELTVLEDNKKAINLYKKIGFVKEGVK